MSMMSTDLTISQSNSAAKWSQIQSALQPTEFACLLRKSFQPPDHEAPNNDDGALSRTQIDHILATVLTVESNVDLVKVQNFIEEAATILTRIFDKHEGYYEYDDDNVVSLQLSIYRLKHRAVRGWRLNHWLFLISTGVTSSQNLAELGLHVGELICELILRTYAKNMDLTMDQILEISAIEG